MYLVGVTGGIGSGKSTVAAAMRARGWPVIDADEVAREIVAPGEAALTALAERFGDAIVRDDGTLDRPALARLAFADDTSRAALDRITHPHIAARIAARLAELGADHRDATPLIAAVDHPLLIETGQAGRFDEVVVVLADEATRVERLVEQRGLAEDDARARIRAQTDDATRRAAASHVVVNEGTREALAAATSAVLDAIELAAARRHAGRGVGPSA
ncbi:dephospho-CoA kinase [Nitriliruptoraceae bacterium ZYF776]|nr:dephospho-CoA kinase [Profundirhabdus halotolerans]